jgi:hypothetical protein
MKPMSHLDYEWKTVGLTIRERSITPMALAGGRANEGEVSMFTGYFSLPNLCETMTTVRLRLNPIFVRRALL